MASWNNCGLGDIAEVGGDGANSIAIMGCIDIYNDTFTQADENPLASGNNWISGLTIGGNSTDLRVVSNKVRVANVGASVIGWQYVNAVGGAINMCVQAKLATWAGLTDDEARVIMRVTGSTHTTGYAVHVVQLSDGSAALGIRRYIGGTAALLGSTGILNVSAGDVLGGSVFGTTISGYLNGHLAIEATDVNIASGFCGMGITIGGGANPASDVELSDFKMGVEQGRRSQLFDFFGLPG